MQGGTPSGEQVFVVEVDDGERLSGALEALKDLVPACVSNQTQVFEARRFIRFEELILTILRLVSAM